MVFIAEHEGLRHRLGSPRVIAIAEYLINSASDTETGISPYDLLYGRRDSSVFDIFKKEIDDTTDDLNQSEYIKVLREEFALVHSFFLKAQQECARRTTIENTTSLQKIPSWSTRRITMLRALPGPTRRIKIENLSMRRRGLRTPSQSTRRRKIVHRSTTQRGLMRAPPRPKKRCKISIGRRREDCCERHYG